MTDSLEIKSYRWFEGKNLLQIAMPMGGIGGGCVCLNGIGGIIDFSIRNTPATTAMPDGHGFADTAFALIHVKGEKPTTRLVEGPMPLEKIYDQGLQAQGYRKGGHEGLPRFSNCKFGAAYPFGAVRLSDDSVPLSVCIIGWSPFVPLDDRTSGMPCAVLEYKLTNTSAKAVEYEFSYHLSHLAKGKTGLRGTRNKVIENGIQFYNTENPHAETYASASLSVIGHWPAIKAMWMRGRWFDWIASLWREASEGTFRPNNGNTDRDLDGENGGSILLSGKLSPGESITYPIAITWYFPNVNYTAGTAEEPKSDPAIAPKWRNYYAGQWSDAADVAADLQNNFTAIRQRTSAFADALHQSTLPPEAIDAIASNLAILKSPTILRQENGNLWAWEGCFTQAGCCHGSCTHVWNYAQAIPHLFPALERTFREQELQRSMKDSGHVVFRSALPDGPPTEPYIVSGQDHAAADGQLGGILKVYRDWQISGDKTWLQKMYPLVRKSLQYCIRTWDPDHKGALFEPHHNTYDIEFWGPDGMCTSIYLGALAAMVEMAREMKDSEADEYLDLLEKGGRYCDEHLFNGEYFQQKVMWEELRDRSFAKSLESTSTDPEALRVMREDGPNYQYGDGCLSDGVIGMWMARLYGVDCAMNQQHIRSTLAAIHRHNFRSDLWNHACTQRPGYAMGHEAGLLLCTWPRGNRPTLPFVYSDEVWTGIEYQVASHLIEEGMTDEGLEIIRGARSRYEGHTRNPFNEYECGSYYARAMASYALLQSLSGFRYSLTKKTLWFGPKLAAPRPFKSFFSTASGYGSIVLDYNGVHVQMLSGELAVDILVLTTGNITKEIQLNKVFK